MFSHFTNRETFTFSCNFQSEKEDITYAFKFDPNKGTYQIDSSFIEMLQTPGAVVVLDEINTLPPGVAKMLNPLLDYRRTLYLPDGREIKAHPSVLIIGTMNPQNYLGVKPLSQEVKSRARILYVDYPPEK
jgi:MoxR-like ATPase